MKLARFAIVACAALALVAMALDTQAGRGRGGGGHHFMPTAPQYPGY